MSQISTIVNFALSYVGKKPARYYSGGMTYCQRFVTDAYVKAGLSGSAGSAAAARNMWMKAGSKSTVKNAPAGAAVYLPSSSYPQYGHVGISVGSGMMVDVGTSCITKRAIPSTALGWGWNGGKQPDGTTDTVTYKTVTAEFTGYCTCKTCCGANAKGITANGEIADATKKTCAAPKSIAFNTYVKPIGTGTAIDNVVYRVNDRGGAIVIDSNGVYHIDILFSSHSEALSFGRKRGKLLIYSGNPTASYTGSESEVNEKSEMKVYETDVFGRNVYHAVEENYHLYVNDKEITGIVSDLELAEEIDALSAELTFKVPVNPKDTDMFKKVKKPQCGDKVFFENNGNELFRGIIIEVGLDGTVKANDYGFYLNKQEITLQCNGITADKAIEKLCSKVNLVEIGEICSIPTNITQNFIGETPAAVLEKILNIASAEQEKNYLFKVIKGKLCVMPYPTKLTIGMYKQPNGKEWDCTWLLGGVSGSISMEEMRNRVVAVSEDESNLATLAVVDDKASISKYGVMQTVVKAGGDTARTLAVSKLKELNLLTESYSVNEMLGVDAVTSGIIMYFSSTDYGVSGYFLVKSAKHTYCPNHKMALELIKVVKPEK